MDPFFVTGRIRDILAGEEGAAWRIYICEGQRISAEVSAMHVESVRERLRAENITDVEVNAIPAFQDARTTPYPLALL